MQPTTTCNIARRLLKASGSALRTDHEGRPLDLFPIDFASMPDRLDRTSIELLRTNYLAYNLVRKIVLPDEDGTLTKRAIDSFLESETRCYRLNSGTTLVDAFTGPGNRSLRHALIRANQIVRDMIGDRPPAKWYRGASFTGGASTSRQRSKAHPALKFWARPSLEVTSLAHRHLCEFLEDAGDAGWIWENHALLECVPDRQVPFCVVVPGSRLDNVEKNYRTKRTILIEPDGNMFLQKAVGDIFREALRSAGIDLNDQTLNQVLAFHGSVDGSLATLDLSAASDSISLAFARLLLPEAWYTLLYELRSPVTLMPDGTWHTMRKLSSMGNGFTFELESLLFYALTQAAVDILDPHEKRVGVYGDDIIVSSEVAPFLTELLGKCGFALNMEKSYWAGPFRESCGRHYINGVDVTPVHVSGDLSELNELFRLANQLHAWESLCAVTGDFPLTRIVLSHIREKDRNCIPPQEDETSGLRFFFDHMGFTPIAIKRCRGSLIKFKYKVYVAKRTVLDCFSDECRWLYDFMMGFRATSVDLLSSSGIVEPVPLALVIEGARGWEWRSVPAVTAVIP